MDHYSWESGVKRGVGDGYVGHGPGEAVLSLLTLFKGGDLWDHQGCTGRGVCGCVLVCPDVQGSRGGGCWQH